MRSLYPASGPPNGPPAVHLLPPRPTPGFGFGERRLPPDIESALYRIVQEGITNVVRHAHATRVGVILEFRGSDVICIIEDNGCGIPPEQADEHSSRSLELVGMRERLASVDGTVELETEAGRGTALFVRVPLGRPS